MKFDTSPPVDASVAQGLAGLKREGGSVLVVGAACDAQRTVCDRFLEGEDPAVFVDTDRPVRDGDAEAVERLERTFSTRSAAAGEAPSPASGITSLGADLETAILGHTHDDHEDTLRVCFDSLRPFVDATDVQDLTAALASLGETARDTSSLVHVHLPAMPEAVPRSLFEAVDAVVEVRRQNRTTYQRWRFPGATDATDWIEV